MEWLFWIINVGLVLVLVAAMLGAVALGLDLTNRPRGHAPRA